jgi:tyrosinase
MHPKASASCLVYLPSPIPSPCRPQRLMLGRQNLSRKEKREYINAELCLMSLPTKTGLPAAVTRFDDLIKSHQMQAFSVHGDVRDHPPIICPLVNKAP